MDGKKRDLFFGGFWGLGIRTLGKDGKRGTTKKYNGNADNTHQVAGAAEAIAACLDFAPSIFCIDP